MAMSTYRVTFDDGSYIDKVADQAGLAKEQARNERILEVDPGRRMLTADRLSHSRVKVASVRELSEDERAPRRDDDRRDDDRRDDDRRDDNRRDDNRRDDRNRTEGDRRPQVIT